MSINKVTVKQLECACDFYCRMKELGATDNLAVRPLELLANIYAKYKVIGNTTPDRADQFNSWSKKALKVEEKDTKAKFGQIVRNDIHPLAQGSLQIQADKKRVIHKGTVKVRVAFP